jgi:uncharacterized protein
MASLRLDLSAVKSGRNRARFTADPADLGLPEEAWPTPFEVEVEADRSGDQITVHGTVVTGLEEECARCLTRLRAPLDFGFDLHADRAGTGGKLERALTEDDYVIFHDGRSLDLDEEVREAALLARPMAALCRPDCRGLCLRCGADLNEGPCGCAPAP